MLANVILDADVFSFLAKGDTRAALYLPHLVGHQRCVCFQTFAELRLWAILKKWGKHRGEALDLILSHYVILPYDPATVQKWAELKLLSHGS